MLEESSDADIFEPSFLGKTTVFKRKNSQNSAS